MEERRQMIEAGMDDFVGKPYRANEIYACLSKHLGVKYIYEGFTHIVEYHYIDAGYDGQVAGVLT